ncbi:ParB/RepB/Spo0J family partition protein [Erythrobacteraceae bacterium E2-1 Yellow Sea]|nr:ParB/RepB/Spo0J family partition protein [Erythrobacteraceae bacterium E2-1 Yellow Sea]
MSDTSDPIRFSVPHRSASDNKRRLGKGLGALLGETRREEPLARNGEGGDAGNSSVSGVYGQSGLASLAISSIDPLPGQPRKRFDDAALAELSASIAARGVIQPIIVRPKGGARYQLVAGERRWRAAQKAQLHEIPALVRDLDDREVMALALIENIQREDLNPVEEARAYHRLSEEEGMTQAEIAEMVDKSRSHVANLQRLLNLPADVLDFVEDGRLSMGHARALIGHEKAAELARRAVNDNLSVREVEKLARGDVERPAKAAATRNLRDPAKNADIEAVQAHLEEFLGLTVRIKTDADPRSGAVTIRYRTLDQLDLICQRLTGGDI